MYRWKDAELQVFLAHPGGPFFAHKDDGHWTIPKGEVEPGEDYRATALREFQEEIGLTVSSQCELIELGSIRQKGGKIVHAWGVEGDCLGPIRSNHFQCEWPMGSGQFQSFPEVDRAQFFALPEARRNIKETQIPLLDALESTLQKRRAH